VAHASACRRGLQPAAGLTDFSKTRHFQKLLGGAATITKSHGGELYFETDELESVCERLLRAGVEFIHPIEKQPWGQRVARFYDPDGHVIEAGELMEPP
jgi:catechol 2,3-dioxygenase-like lactoylglutathione lyase family enzyme